MGIQRVESSISAETAVREKAVDELQRQLDDQYDRLRDMTHSYRERRQTPGTGA
jgi:hypothetical protein